MSLAIFGNRLNDEGPPEGGPYRNQLGLLVNFGAGEEIRTLDPNLGKVMLYP